MCESLTSNFRVLKCEKFDDSVNDYIKTFTFIVKTYNSTGKNLYNLPIAFSIEM